MCGIVGIIAKSLTKNFTHKHKEVFQEMLYIDALRGEDSTGVYSVNKYGNVKWEKEAVLSHEFLKHTAVRGVIDSTYYSSAALVGHNRKATKGTIKDENAHPFVEGNTILVHNGTLLNHKTLNDTVEVDSHAIAHSIEEFGVEETIAKLNGAFAIATYKVDEQKLYLFRNKERPLWLCELEDAWVFASEPWIMFGPLWRRQIKLVSPPKELDVAKLYTFDFNQTQVDFKVSEEVELYKEPSKSLVIPFKKTEKTSATTTGSKINQNKKLKLDEFIKEFDRGQLVCFSPSSMRRGEKNFVVLVGKHCIYENVVVQGFSDETLSLDESLALINHQELVGYISSIRYDSTREEVKIYAKDVTISAPIVTANGLVLNEEYVERLSGVCDVCNENINEENLSESFVHINKNGKVQQICPECLEAKLQKHPHFGGIAAYRKQQGASV